MGARRGPHGALMGLVLLAWGAQALPALMREAEVLSQPVTLLCHLQNLWRRPPDTYTLIHLPLHALHAAPAVRLRRVHKRHGHGGARLARLHELEPE